jgi:hypothetical protein
MHLRQRLGNIGGIEQMRDRVIAGDHDIERPFDTAEVAEVSHSERGFDSKPLSLAARSLDFAFADICADDAIAEPGKPDRLRPDPARTVEHRASTWQLILDKRIKRVPLPLDGALPVASVSEVIVGGEAVVERNDHLNLCVSHRLSSRQGSLRQSPLE